MHSDQFSRRSALKLAGAGTVLSTLPWAATAQGAAAEIPVDVLFKRAAYRSLRLSPSTRFMSALIPIKERANLVVLDIEGRKANSLTDFSDSDVASVFWANDNRLLFTTGDQQGKEFRGNGGLYAIDRDGKNARVLVEPFSGGRSVRFVPRITTVLARIPSNTDEVLVSANDRSVDTQDIYRMNIHNGRKTLVSVSSPGNVAEWTLDNNREPRATLSIDMEKRRWWTSVRLPGSQEWKTIAQWDEQLNGVILPDGFDPADPNKLIVRSNIGRDTLAFFYYDIAQGKLGDLIYGNDRFDMGTFALIGPDGLGEGATLLFDGDDDNPAKVAGVRFVGERDETIWFDKKAQQFQDTLDRALPNRLNTFNPLRKRSLVVSRASDGPTSWYIFDREKMSLEETGVKSHPWLEGLKLSPMQTIRYKARDGLLIDAYLTLPVGYKKGDKVPLVLHPHGGPWARDVWGFNPEVQFLANRGYAVLQPNFRGSTGYGAKHLKASYKQWGGTMTDDMIDGIEGLIADGIVDPKRVAVYGASYGGFATLSVMVKRPDLFKWGVAYVAVTDMKVHQDTQPAQKRGDFGPLAKIINGDQSADAAMFKVQSPGQNLDKLAAPVFFAWGADDVNVDFENARYVRPIMDKLGKPYEWMSIADEAHGYRQTKNVVDFYSRFDAFQKKHLPKP